MTQEKIEEAFEQIAAAVEEQSPGQGRRVPRRPHRRFQHESVLPALAQVSLSRRTSPSWSPPAARPRPPTAPLDPEAVLPYSVVALNLMRLKALDRLVIVDACQAEAILPNSRSTRSRSGWK